jgi:glyoxylase-like metal-dependent hydrolase (beta-lactamase superfamily II)
MRFKKSIDFSCKHDILIRNPDGSLQPEDEPFFQSKTVGPGAWQILSDGDYSYLVEGDNEALVIDSGYGCGNIREYCQTLTDKPISKIANTHHHFDHTANNSYFDRAYMSAQTRELATIPFPSFEGIIFPRDYPVQVIGQGFKFQLGNREIETFEITDHTMGSLSFLDPKGRFLFSGDELVPFEKTLRQASVELFEKQLRAIASRRNEFDKLCGGNGIHEGYWIDRYLECARYILAGHEGLPVSSVTIQEPPKPVPGTKIIYDRMLPRPPDRHYPSPEGQEYRRLMEYAGCKIIYDIRKIHNGAHGLKRG